MSPGASSLGSSLAASGGATWLQDADGEAFAALGLTYKRIGRTKRLGGLFVIDPERRLRFAFMRTEKSPRRNLRSAEISSRRLRENSATGAWMFTQGSSQRQGEPTPPQRCKHRDGFRFPT